ncbi:MAG: 4Fe-4S dicluster domain-containing protein [Verrucomicrobiales bacterium]|jgi:ferredoxin|nr:4Fe-4S dicluster domain-containing protein [Verrucomicrobiales bacterium]
MKHRNILRRVRIILAALVMVGVSLAFLDYRDWLSAAFKHALTMMQFVPAALAVSGAALAILIVSALVGRVYCSVVCPLGILQDIVMRAANLFRRKKKFLGYKKPANKLRYSILAAVSVSVSVAAGAGGAVLAWLDPYSNFGRLAGNVLRPLIVSGNNLASEALRALGTDAVPRVTVHWVPPAVLAATLMVTAAVVALAVWRGRLYCNTICPVGALLGLVAKFSLWKLTIDQAACKKCGDCLRACKAQCINLRAGEIDFSRCVACYNCVAVCDEHGIKYRFQNPLKYFRARQTPADGDVNLDRRHFLVATVSGTVAVGTRNADGGKFGHAVMPPGAQNRDRFLVRCTACQLCVSACPSHVLEPSFLEYASVSGFMKPRLNFNHSFCNINCVTCGEVCPDGALLPLTVAQKQTARIGLAVFDHQECIIYRDGTACGACAEHCPTAALQIRKTDKFRDPLPVVDEQYCIGCGACQYACPALPKKAITISGLRTHETAQVLKQEKVKAAADEFPF